MELIGLFDICVCSMIKNEIEILPMYYRYIKKWCKRWKVLDHGSDDGSLEFLQHMKDRHEIDIEVFQRPMNDFSKDFYGEWNWILDKSDCKWTYVGHIDEVSPFMDKILSVILEYESIFIIKREELISLLPPLTMGKEQPFMRIFPTKWKTRFTEDNHVHTEQFNADGKPIRLANIQFYHLGELRNTEHIRFKEKSYEDCSGNSILGSKFSDEDRENRRDKATILKDECLSLLADMIL